MTKEEKLSSIIIFSHNSTFLTPKTHPNLILQSLILMIEKKTSDPLF